MANHGPTNMANHGPTNMASHELTIVANQTIKNSVPKCNQENGIRIFDPTLFEDTVVSKIMEDSNTKCYVMNNEEKFFSIKTISGNFVLLMKKTRAKKCKVRMFYHLQNLSWGVFGLGVFVQGFLLGVYVWEVFVQGFFVLSPYYWFG